MMDQRLAPGMQDGEEPDPSAEMFRIQGDFLERSTHSTKQETVDDAWVLERQRCEGLRHREDDVRVGHRQHLGLACLEPVRLGTTLTLRTVTVAARVVRDPLVSAAVAFLDVTTQVCSPAGGDRIDDRTLLPAPGGDHSLGVRRFAALLEDLGKLVPRSLAHLLGRLELRAQRIQRTLDRTEPHRGHVRVDGRALERPVTQQRLDHPQIRARLQQVRREAMALIPISE